MRESRGGIEYPFVSVVTINWNGERFLRALLPLLEAQSYPRDRFEIIVFDNGSTEDDSVDYVKSSFPDVRIVENGVNDGFSRGCNLAIGHAEGDFIVLVNNDTAPDSDWLSELVRCALEEEGCGAVTSKVLFAGREAPTINNAGTMLRPDQPWPVEELGFELPDGPRFNVRREITALCGASLLLNRRMLEDIGLFDETFFLYFEDTDLAWRGQKAGWRYYYEPASVIYHEHGGSTIPQSDTWTFHVTRNRMFVLWKNAGLFLAAKVSAAFVYRFFVKPPLQIIRKRNVDVQKHTLHMGGLIAASFTRYIGLMLLKRFGVASEKGLGTSRPRSSRRPAEGAKKATRIGVYDTYLATRGGGEKVCLSLASALASEKDSEVLVITTGEADLDELADYFNIDLSRVKVHSLSKHRVLDVLLHRWLRGVALQEFVTDWLALRALRRMELDVFVNSTYRSRLPSAATHSFYLCMFPHEPATSAAHRGAAIAAYRRAVDVLYRVFVGVSQARAIDTYGTILCNSQFTRDYVRRFWGRDSSILYPICDDMSETDGPGKEKVILNVGRFFAPDGASHHKNHALMIEQFSELHLLIESGWELHLVGSLADDKESLLHVIQLHRLAEGLPVHFHIDAPFADLQRLYNAASIYWHATGFGADPEEAPETQEHFGITTGEAMTAGAIPIVTDAAGQREIVEHGVSGFLWSSVDELRDFTMRVASMDPDEAASLRRNASKAAQRFGREAFVERVHKFFGPESEVSRAECHEAARLRS